MNRGSEDAIFVNTSDSESLSQLEEARRLVNHQIEQIRHYENRAERILRIFIASIGLSITGVSILVSASDITISDIRRFTDIISNNLGPVSKEMAEFAFLNEGASIIIALILTVCLALMIPASIFLLLGVGAAEAWKVIKPESPDPVALPIDNEGSVKRYSSIIEINTELLEKKEEGLHNALRSGVYSIVMFMTAMIFVVLPFAIQSATVAMFGFLLIVLWTIYESYNRLDKNDVLNFLRPRPVVDSLVVVQWLILVGVESRFIGYEYEGIAFIVFSGLISGTIAIYVYVDFWELIQYVARLAAGGIMLTLLFLIFGLEAIPLAEENRTLAMLIAFMGVSICGVNAVFSFAVSMLRAAVRQIPDWLIDAAVERKNELLTSIKGLWG